MQNDAEVAGLIVNLVFTGVFCFGSLAINVAVAWILSSATAGLPEPYRSEVGPGQAFLLVIPLFNLVWRFIYLKKLSQAYQTCFAGYRSPSDDCGEQLGLYWAICSACTLIPCLGLLTGIAALVLTVVYLIKIHECKNRLQPLLLGGAPMAAPMSPNPYGDAGPSQDNPYGPTNL